MRSNPPDSTTCRASDSIFAKRSSRGCSEDFAGLAAAGFGSIVIYGFTGTGFLGTGFEPPEEGGPEDVTGIIRLMRTCCRIPTTLAVR